MNPEDLHNDAVRLRKWAGVLDTLSRAHWTDADLAALASSDTAARDARKAVREWTSRRVVHSLQKVGIRLADDCVMHVAPYENMRGYKPRVGGRQLNVTAKHISTLHETRSICMIRLSFSHALVVRVSNLDDSDMAGKWAWDLWEVDKPIGGGVDDVAIEMAREVKTIITRRQHNPS